MHARPDRAIDPVLRSAWLLEIATPVVGFVVLAASRRWFAFTELSYLLLFLEAVVLIVGAHYTHERVPLFDALRPAFGWQRNHYDRFAHFCVGVFLVIPWREVLARKTPVRGPWLAAVAVLGILALAALYEISEWAIAVLASPEAGAAYLGSQGDEWDAQKDMLMDGLGAVAGVVVFARLHDRKLRARRLAGDDGPPRDARD